MPDEIEVHGLLSSLYSDRGSYYWHTPEAGGKVDQNNPTQFGRALRHPGIEMIAVYSPEARGQSERAFSPHQERLPNELALAGITDREARQPLFTRNPYACCQHQVCLSGTGTRSSFRAMDWRQSGGVPWTTQAGRLQPRRKETAPIKVTKANNSCATKPDNSKNLRHCWTGIAFCCNRQIS